MAKPRIVVIGSINMDLVVDSGRLPAPGETIRGGELQMIPGGKGANQAVAAARLGADVEMVGRVGSDDLGTALRDGLEKANVDVRHVKRTPGASGTAIILVQNGGENSIVLSPGANGHVTRKDIDAAIPLIRRADAVLLQLEVPHAAVRHAISVCRKLGVRTVLDPAPASSSLPAAFFKVDVISPNQSEAAALLGGAGLNDDAICRRLIKKGARNVVLKLGPRGSLHADGSHVLTKIAGFKIKPIDTTAAGDTFTAALAVAIGEGKAWADALRFANAAGALACMKFGAQPSIPKRAEVLAMLKKN